MRVGGWAAAKALLVADRRCLRRRHDVGGDSPRRAPGGPRGGRRRRGVRRSSRSPRTAARCTRRCRPPSPSSLPSRCLTSPAPTWWHDVGVLVALIVLPWLAVKYAPVVAVLGIALLLRHRHDTRRIAVLAGGAAVAALAYLVAHRAWYGGWTVYASGDHFAETGELSVVGTKVNLLGRSRRLAGLLVDRDFGIAAWSPVWLLAPFGLGSADRPPLAWPVVGAGGDRGRVADGDVRRPDHARLLGAGSPDRRRPARSPRSAWPPSPPARCAGLTVTAALGAVGLVTWCWLAIESSTGRRTLIFDFAVDGSLALPGDATPAAVRPRSDRRRPGAARRLGRPRPRHGLARLVPRVGQVEAGLGNLGAISAIRRSGRHFCQLLAEMAPRLARCRCLSTTSSSMRTIFPGSLGSGARCSIGRSCPSASGRS